MIGETRPDSIRAQQNRTPLQVRQTIMSQIAERMQAVRERISRAAADAGRQPEEIRLLAVSKTFASGDIAEAVGAGQFAFGENYVQEAIAKIAALHHLPQIEWHLIGPLQTNKTAVAAKN